MKSSYSAISFVTLAIPFLNKACGLTSQLPSVRYTTSIKESGFSTSPSFSTTGTKKTSLTMVLSEQIETQTADEIIKKTVLKKIRRLEKDMMKQENFRRSLLEKLANADRALQSLEQKKKDYLEGMQIGVISRGGKFSETTLRSAVKAMLWRVIAGSVTFVTALRFSKSLSSAFSIVGSDFFSKSLTMFIGERLMNKSQAGRKSGADDVARSLAKALIWRLFAICNTLTMSLFFAKDLKVASQIAGSDAIFKTGLMIFYERVWTKVEWGKEYIIEFSI